MVRHLIAAGIGLYGLSLVVSAWFPQFRLYWGGHSSRRVPMSALGRISAGAFALYVSAVILFASHNRLKWNISCAVALLLIIGNHRIILRDRETFASSEWEREKSGTKRVGHERHSD